MNHAAFKSFDVWIACTCLGIKSSVFHTATSLIFKNYVSDTSMKLGLDGQVQGPIYGLLTSVVVS